MREDVALCGVAVVFSMTAMDGGGAVPGVGIFMWL